MIKIRAEHPPEKISFASELLELYISGREGEKVPCTSTSYLPWLRGRAGMFYFLSAEQAWLHSLQAVPTPLSCIWKQEPWALISGMQVSTLKTTPRHWFWVFTKHRDTLSPQHLSSLLPKWESFQLFQPQCSCQPSAVFALIQAAHFRLWVL